MPVLTSNRKQLSGFFMRATLGFNGKSFERFNFSQVLLKDFNEIFQNSYWEKYTFQ